MPCLRVVKSTQIKKIPCNNPFPYADTVKPIYEVHRVLQKEMVELCCRQTHCIRVRSTKVPENDNLYELFTRYTNNDIDFICQWLKVFNISNQWNLKQRASKYLASKGLLFDNWSCSITDRMKGDIFVLFRLCMLFKKHGMVHLRNGLVWTLLAQLTGDHYGDLKKCDLHLCYIGRGLFIE